MLRVTTATLCTYCQRMRLVVPPSVSTVTSPGKTLENQHTVDSLCNLSVDVRKIRHLKGWILSERSAFVAETADLLRDMGADTTAITRILERHPEAVLCRPEEIAAQRDLWESVCRDKRELMGIVEKFPASFFTLAHHRNQRANVLYLQSLRLDKRTICKLMASAPQSFSRPVGRNQEVIGGLRGTYLDLGGDEGDLHCWLQELFAQNLYVLLQPPEAWGDSLAVLRHRGFTTQELLVVLSGLRASVAELEPEAMRQAMAFVEEAFSCTEDELKRIVTRCPAVLCCSFPTLVGRFQGLMDVGLTVEQVKEAPNVLELPPQMMLYRVHKLASCGHDVRSGSLEVILGSRKDFEINLWKLQLRQRQLLSSSADPLLSADN